MKIDTDYTRYYKNKGYKKVYPTEYVVRSFLAFYPGLKMDKLKKGSKVLDVGCGDGRNLIFLWEQGYDCYGTEITQEICDLAIARMEELSGENLWGRKIVVGRNCKMPFDDESFDAILACHSCYYCDEGTVMADNVKEYSRILKKGGYLITDVISKNAYLMNGAQENCDGTMTVVSDPYQNRVGYRLFAASNYNEIEEEFSDLFTNFSFGVGNNNWYGIEENVFYMVCQKR